MLETQKALRSGTSLDELAMEFNLDCRRHAKYPLVVLNYGNDSPKFHPIVRECRGLVMEEGSWDVVGKPPTRFYNHGEHPEETKAFDWSSFRMDEKVDGTFILVSPYKGDWIVSTRGTFGDHAVTNSGWTWEQLFWKTARFTPEMLYQDTCYAFELWTPFNAVVTRYEKPSVWLLYAYDLLVGNEWHESACNAAAIRLRVKTPMVFKFHDSIDHIRRFLADVSKDEPDFEGVVLKDRNGIRMKVKTDTYLELHKFFGNGSIYAPKRLVPLWCSGAFDEVLRRFPNVEIPLREVGVKLDDECSKLYKLWNDAKGIESQKEFARYVLPRTEFSAILFGLRKRYQLDPNAVTFEVFRKAFLQWPDLIIKKLFNSEAVMP